MDVRQSLNVEDNLAVVTGDGHMSFVEGDSFYAKAPPMAASTVGRTKARRLLKPDFEMGSFLDECPPSYPELSDIAKSASFDSMYSGARPKTHRSVYSDNQDTCSNGSNRSDENTNTSLGIIDVNNMDLFSSDLLLDPMQKNLPSDNTKNNPTLDDFKGPSSKQSSINVNGSVDSQSSQHGGSSSYKQHSSTDSNTWKHDGSSNNNSQDSKREQQLLARSNLGTVKKTSQEYERKGAVKAMCGMLFGGQDQIGEEGECDESVYNIELEADDLDELDADFEVSIAVDSDHEKSPDKTPTNKTTSASAYGDEIVLDSVYFRPGTTGEETHPQLPYLSKVSLFDGGSGSELDTEDELELVRKAQGERREAAGEDSDGSGRPGLEGLSLTDETRQQLPITQRQSAEGNVVTSPVPGDGGGGGDGSSATDSDDDKLRSQSYSITTTTEHQEQRIRPMGDDLLSDLRFRRYASMSTGQTSEDVPLSPRYLTPGSAEDDSVQPSFNIDEFLASRNSPLDVDFDPGNRLEASGCNAEDASATNNQASNPFDDLKSSSFGSFGLTGTGDMNDGAEHKVSLGMFDIGNGADPGTDHGSFMKFENSRASDPDLQTSLGNRSAASGSPSNEDEMLIAVPLTSVDRDSGGTQGRQLSSPRSTSRPDSGGQPLSDNEIFRKPVIPAPKAAKFSQSQARRSSTSCSSSSKSGGHSSNRSSVKSSASESVDLELRTSLSGRVREQTEGLRRVPSCGGTSALDLTVNDEDFFGFSDGVDMLDADEKQFEEENVFRQDDPMTDAGPANDSWAYRSIMTVARPSWLEDTSQEEEVCVRISVGTFMRGRTEALGSLSGDETVPRPNFGMRVESPPKPTREYGSPVRTPVRTPVRCHSDKEEDCTLTLDSLTKTPQSDKHNPSHTTLKMDDLGSKTPMGNTPQVDESRLLNMDEISMIVNDADFSINTEAKRLKSLMSSKYGSKPGPAISQVTSTSTPKAVRSQPSINSATKPTLSQSSYTGTTRPGLSQSSTAGTSLSSANSSIQNCNNSVFKKPFHIPLSKSSNLSRSFPKVADSNNSMLKQDSKSKQASVDKDFKKDSLKDSLFDTDKESDRSRESQSIDNSNVRNSSHDEMDDVWKSPNSSNFKIDFKLDNFSFSTNKDHKLSCKLFDKDTNPTSKSSQHNSNSTHVNSNQQGSVPSKNSSRHSPVHDKRLLELDMERSRLDTSEVDHGYMPGHHIPDGTEYSQRSDYAHINHKGERREDVAGMDDVGLVESRGFDILKNRSSKPHDNHSQDNHLNSATNVSNKNQHRTNENNLSTVRDLQSQHAIQQTDSNIDRSESGTQVLPTFNKNLQKEHQDPLSDSRNHSSDNNQSQYERPNISGIPPKLSITSFKHNLLPENRSVVSEKPHLLTKQSLIQTGFAQDNLHRDYSVEVMDRIYGKTPVSSHSQAINTDSTSGARTYIPQNRDTINSTHGHQSFHHVTSGNLNFDSHHRDTKNSVHSQQTFLKGDLSSYPLRRDTQNFANTHSYFNTTNATQFSSFHTMNATTGDRNLLHHYRESLESNPEWRVMQESYMTNIGDDNTTMGVPTTDHEPGKGHMTMTCVEVPGVLRYKDVCCVGISCIEILPLYNPTDTWMECVIQKVECTIHDMGTNGTPLPMETFPFSIRHEKIIIPPRKTEKIDVMFFPKQAGAYNGHIQIFSKISDKAVVLPVNVNIEAISEEPAIQVYEMDREEFAHQKSVNFGDVEWGSITERTICIRNLGLAAVPLRLALTSNGQWHCFSFDTDRESDVSIISGHTLMSGSSHGQCIINLTLNGSHQPFNYQEVRVRCKPPDKDRSTTKALHRSSPELIRCKMDVEVDIPSCTLPKLSTFNFQVRVGIKKLHIQSNLKELRMKCVANEVVETQFSVFNAGNLPLDVWFGFSQHETLFTVSPASQAMLPRDSCEVKVTFKPTESTLTRLASLLLMCIQPEGQVFELPIQAEVKRERELPIKLYCDQTLINFGGVALGKTCIKKFSIKKDKHMKDVNVAAIVKAENILVAHTPDQRTVGSKSLNLLIPNDDTKSASVYVLYHPVTTSTAEGRVAIRPIPSSSSLQFSVKIAGYGGVSRLCSTSPVRGDNLPCVSINTFSLGSVTETLVNNIGERPACVQVKVFKDVTCSQLMMSAQVVVEPSEFTIGINSVQTIKIVLGMTEHEFMSQTDRHGVGAVLCLMYEDLVDSKKPYRSKLLLGLVKGHHTVSVTKLDQVDFASTVTPSLSSAHPRKQFLFNTDSNLMVSPRSTRSVDSNSSQTVDADEWYITPKVLYFSRKASNNISASNIALNIFCIHNTSINSRGFEIEWPSAILSVTPSSGWINNCENISINACLSPDVSSQPSEWSGEITVISNGVRKSIKASILCDDPRYPVQDPVRSPRLAVSGSVCKQLGNLQISRTIIEFDPTQAGKMSEECIELSNLSNQQLRWSFTSFAPPYLCEKNEKNRAVSRKPYKVFEFSQQFGKLTSKASVKLTVKFMPQSHGLYTQYWDLKLLDFEKTDHRSSNQDFIRVHLTGDCLKDSRPVLTEVDNLLERPKLRLAKQELTFPTLAPGNEFTLKTEIRNSHNEDTTVEVTMAPKAPFYLKHCKPFIVAKKRFVRYPVEFCPKSPGTYTDLILFTSDNGQQLSLRVKGVCVANTPGLYPKS